MKPGLRPATLSHEHGHTQARFVLSPFSGICDESGFLMKVDF